MNDSDSTSVRAGVPEEVINNFTSLTEFDSYAHSINNDLLRARAAVEHNITVRSSHSTPQRRRVPRQAVGLDLSREDCSLPGRNPEEDHRDHPPFGLPSFENILAPAGSDAQSARFKDTNPLNFDVPDPNLSCAQPPPQRLGCDNSSTGNGRFVSRHDNFIRGPPPVHPRGIGNRLIDASRETNSLPVHDNSIRFPPPVPCPQRNLRFSNDTNFPDTTYSKDKTGLDQRDIDTQMYNFFNTPVAFRKRPMGAPSHSSTQVGSTILNSADTFCIPNQTFPIPSSRQGSSNVMSGTNAGYSSRQADPYVNASSFPGYGNMTCSNLGFPVRGPEPKVPKFSGLRHEYSEWKLSFRMVMDSYPDNVRIPILKDHLDSGSLAMVSFISVADPDAYAQIWVELDKCHSSGGSEPHYHTGQLLKLIRRKRCANVEDLEHVHNELRFHWAKLCRLGPRYAGYAESVLVGISDILYGQSQSEVDRLAFENRNFNVASVLNAIWSHIGQARARQHRLSSDANAGQGFNPMPKQSSSRASPTVFRNNVVSFAENPVSSKEIDFHKSRRDASPYPTGAHRTTSLSPSRRGELSRSPSPRPSKVYKCVFCSSDDHKSIACAKWTSAQFYEAACRKYLCFVCLTPNHQARICPYPTWCQTPECQLLPHHAPCLCKALLSKANQ